VAVAEAIANAAATPPAMPYDPVAADTSRTMPIPIIAIDIRPTNPAAKNARDPGTENRSRYAPVTVARSYVAGVPDSRRA
jgi:hypothetical protein